MGGGKGANDVGVNNEKLMIHTCGNKAVHLT